MRKFVFGLGADIETFQPMIGVTVRDEQGAITVLYKGPVEIDKEIIKYQKYTSEETNKLKFVDKLLAARNEPEMTEEEMDFMVDPMHIKVIDALIKEPEDMQHLAGFRVEKKIIPIKQGE